MPPITAQRRGGLRARYREASERMEQETAHPSAVQHEPRWHASLAVLVALGLYITLPQRLTIGPAWVAPLMVLIILVPLSIFAPRRRRENRRVRFAGILLIAIVNFFNIASVALLIRSFFHPAKIVELQSAALLLQHGAQIWITNIIVFALWYWELDGDGPDARAHVVRAAQLKNADFLFPQMTLQNEGRERCAFLSHDWKPQFVDYLYVSFVNSTAFSPADVLPLSRMAKMLMLAEATISLVTIAIVLARSVSLIQ